MSTPNYLVQFQQLEKRFPGTQAPAVTRLQGGIARSGITGLVGPDGAGKTTLVRLIAGLLLPSSGSVIVDGRDPVREGSVVRQRIGYMPQRFGLYEDLTVNENLSLHADLRGVTEPERAKVFERLLRFTNLQRFTARPAGKLSGGMKQKLGLACALLGHPSLLLLDEPGVGVDPISRRELWAMVKELARGGMTVLWSTAYLEEAEQCDELLVLNAGNLLFSGKPAEMTHGLEGRSVQITRITENRRQVLTRARRDPRVLDGTVQGKNLRLLLREIGTAPNPRDLGAGEEARIEAVPPRFEDAFVDRLGGGAPTESVLAQRTHRLSGNQHKVVEADALTKQFGKFTAADQVSFTVQRGEVFGLLGPNGAGKSTTFRMLCGLLRPTSGHARILGLDLDRHPGQVRQRLGYMAQKFSLYGALSVHQNLEFFSGAYGLRGTQQKQVVAEMVEVFHLQQFLEQSPETLPLGFKQRLALACAIMHEPDLLFLDEPTSGVDPLTRREFWTHINGLVEKGVTVIVTTHFMEEAEYCDRAALINQGRVIATSTPDDLKAMAVSPELPDPSMEDAFISLIQRCQTPPDA